MSEPVTIPANSVDAVRLIVEEAAGLIDRVATSRLEAAAPDDWRTRTAANVMKDHVKKLAWVYSLLNGENKK